MIWDVSGRKIPNLLILVGLIIGIVITMLGKGITGMLLFLLYVLIGTAILFIFFFCRILGGGDVKLYGLIAGYLGLKGFGIVVCASFIIGAIISLIKLIINRNMKERLRYFMGYIERTYKTHRILPYYNSSSEVKKSWTISFTVPIFIGYICYLALILL